MEEQMNQNQNQENQPVQPASQEAPKTESSDVEKNKSMAIIGYIISILFFVPLLNEESKKSPYAKFHANQQLILLIYWIGGWIAIGIISFILAITIFLAPLAFLFWLAYTVMGIVFMIMGAVSASKGEMKKLPMIGKYQIIK